MWCDLNKHGDSRVEGFPSVSYGPAVAAFLHFLCVNVAVGVPAVAGVSAVDKVPQPISETSIS